MQVFRRPIAAWLALSGLALAGGIVEAFISNDIDPAKGVPIAIGMAAGMALAWWSPLGGAAVQLAVVLVQIPFGHQIYDMAIPIYAIAGTTGMVTARERGARMWLGISLELSMLPAILA